MTLPPQREAFWTQPAFNGPKMNKLRVLTIWTACVSSIWAPLAAKASELPNYPVEKWCDQVARAGGTRSELIYGGCIDQEQSAYDHLKGAWGGVPPQTQKWCDQVARSGSGGSYLILNGCVDQEDAARQQNSTRRFQR
ncbi:hypothetical protein BDS110ZK12_39450 [Bradyrhizobium diazoefficiens]|uniref:Uncharacterized protein n=1 Tax=Bradyrhizobium diazoefficiens TaxID=1355477 RepID=A0A810BHT8_9BRAD|nr:hypothetical protein XF8B_56650 [Bradyrhizobium diazoefficiens]